MTKPLEEPKEIIRAVVGMTVYLVLTPATLFIAAGTLRWPMAWLYVVIALVAAIGGRLIVLRRNPDMLRERATASEGVKAWDRVLVPIVALYGPMVTLIIAGLDRRFGWSPPIPVWAQVLAAFLIAAGYGLATWAFVANPFFSSRARIQEDRGHSVVSTGPYAIVRHPGYAGGLVGILMVPLMLDMLWALLPALLNVIAIVVRTALEDRMLREELPGYAAYAQRTQHRLVPGVW